MSLLGNGCYNNVRNNRTEQLRFLCGPSDATIINGFFCAIRAEKLQAEGSVYTDL
jgi:hypothetical protein